MTCEVNFDGLVGPTHNYAGLSYGNVASMSYAKDLSNPREAALEGLKKMHLLMQLGVKQAVLFYSLNCALTSMHYVALGLKEQDQELLQNTPLELLSQVYSASAMWTANAATISPSADSLDGLLHITPANLISTFHRSLEVSATTKTLRKIFSDPNHFIVHDPLPSTIRFADEGAANHTRLTPSHGEAGIQLFAYGKPGERFPRQTILLCLRSHCTPPSGQTSHFCTNKPRSH